MIVLRLKLRLNPIHRLVHIFAAIKGRDSEIPFARRPKTRTRRSHDVAYIQQLIEEIPA